jgi:hypothetical protein
MSAKPARHLGGAWLFLCFALAVHVADEALTGFLSIYNPTVAALREKVPWLPIPVFRFDFWLAGLVVAIAVLTLLSVFAFRNARWIRPAAVIFAVVMLSNAFAHTLATLLGRTVPSVRFSGPMPGFYSSPLLFIASVYLLIQLRRPMPPPTALP